MKIWELIVLGVVLWGALVVLFWPIWDFILVKLKKIPKVKETQETDLLTIYNKGFFYRYSAFKRFKKLKVPKKTAISVAINDFQSFVLNNSPNK